MINCELPYSVLDLKEVDRQIEVFQNIFKECRILYAMKANSSFELLSFMDSKFVEFDAASIFEINHLMKCGVSTENICFGSTIKKRSHIKKAHMVGINVFTTDSFEDASSIIEIASGADIFVRVHIEESGNSEWPLSKKFGCDKQEFVRIIKLIDNSSSRLMGISFHVGSQQLDINGWKNSIEAIEEYIQMASINRIKFEHINIGGGFPANYRNNKVDLKNYLVEVYEELRIRLVLKYGFNIWLEPGRGLVANAGYMMSEVIMVKKFYDQKWVYLDVGKFNGLIETEGEAIKYEIEAVDYRTDEWDNYIVAGPTCDSMDILYEKNTCRLPKDIRSGDYVKIKSTGAYTLEYSSIGFNGYKPMKRFIKRMEGDYVEEIWNV